MVREFHTLAEIAAHGADTVIDVRSPSEYAEDHLPGAINLPVLDDAERARVGTIYKQHSPFQAKIIGAALVARNAARHLEGPLADRPGGWRPLVYCWRGGQRSGALATILTQVGWRAEVLAGGYKSYRRLVVQAMHGQPVAHRLVLLDGLTGTAKTALLHELASRGAQVLDLEGLAAHRGSLLGATAVAQPSQKMFERDLAYALLGLDAGRVVFAEAESSRIGQVFVPPSLWKAMCAAPRITVEAPLAARAAYLARAYADVVGDRDVLEARLASLVPFHGRAVVAAWLELARQGAFRQLAAELMQAHYDPRYTRSQQRHAARRLGVVRAERLEAGDLPELAARIEALAAEVSPG